MLFIWEVRLANSRDQPHPRRTIFLGREIVIEVIFGRLCVELLADVGDVLFGEPRSCEAVEASQWFDLGHLGSTGGE